MHSSVIIGLSIILSIVLPLCIGALTILTSGKPWPHQLMLPIAMAVLSFGSVALFIKGLKEFKQEFRKAFYKICIGMMLYAVAQLQIPIFVYLNIEITAIVILPYLLATVFFLLGIRHFARLVELPTRWASLPYAFAIAIATAIVASFLPHAATALPEVAFDISNGFIVWCAVILFFAAMAAFAVRSTVAPSYHRSLSWLATSFFAFVFSSVHSFIVALVLPADHPYAHSVMMALPALLGSLSFLIAGYVFTQLNRQRNSETQTGSPIEVITYVAGLASNPHEIDVALDSLRSVTVSLHSGDEKLSPKQLRALKDLYLYLEDYLIKKERLRHFTREGLRETVQTRFQTRSANATEFWSIFS